MLSEITQEQGLDNFIELPMISYLSDLSHMESKRVGVTETRAGSQQPW